MSLDPDQTLEELRRLSLEAKLGHNTHYNERNLRWLFDDLDAHLSVGNELPHAWRRLEQDNEL